MVNKKRLIKAELYDMNGNLVISASRLEFPKDYFGVRDTEFVVFRGSNIEQVPTGTAVSAIFYYQNGTRMRYLTQVDLCTDYQVNIHVGNNYEVMEERRQSIKTETDAPCQLTQHTSGDKTTILMPPAHGRILNINLGGIFLVTSFSLEPDDLIDIVFLDSQLEVECKVLRSQDVNFSGQKGYGCQFTNLAYTQEEAISRYIYACQQKMRDKGLV